MNLKEYQFKSARTLNEELTREQVLSNMMMGIQGESGEMADIIKKHLYQGHELDKYHIEEEIGDVMFYIANLCNLLNIDLEAAIEGNYNKLLKRYPKGFDVERSINRDTEKIENREEYKARKVEEMRLEGKSERYITDWYNWQDR